MIRLPISTCIILVIILIGCSNNSSSEDIVAKADLHYNDGNYVTALELYNEAIQLHPDSESAYNARGYYYLQAGSYDLALKDFEKAIELDPRNSKTYYNQGTAYLNMGQYDLALTNYTLSISINPTTNNYNGQGLALCLLEQCGPAIKAFDEAIRLDPLHRRAYFNRGTAYKILGMIPESDLDFQRFEDLENK